MGQVWEAVHAVTRQRCALKLIRTGHTTRAGLRKRLLREARAASSVRHPNVVRSEEHTSELQSLRHLVCRLLLEKKKTKRNAEQTPKQLRDYRHTPEAPRTGDNGDPDSTTPRTVRRTHRRTPST